MQIMMIEQLDDVTPEEIGEELTDSPFEPVPPSDEWSLGPFVWEWFL